jgi:hypothetical protein
MAVLPVQRTDHGPSRVLNCPDPASAALCSAQLSFLCGHGLTLCWCWPRSPASHCAGPQGQGQARGLVAAAMGLYNQVASRLRREGSGSMVSPACSSCGQQAAGRLVLAALLLHAAHAVCNHIEPQVHGAADQQPRMRQEVPRAHNSRPPCCCCCCCRVRPLLRPPLRCSCHRTPLRRRWTCWRACTCAPPRTGGPHMLRVSGGGVLCEVPPPRGGGFGSAQGLWSQEPIVARDLVVDNNLACIHLDSANARLSGG